MIPSKLRASELQKTIYLTRSDVSWYSQNANAFQKPWMLSQVSRLVVLHPEGTVLPDLIAGASEQSLIRCGDVRASWSVFQVMRFAAGCVGRLSGLAQQHSAAGRVSKAPPVRLVVATGFDLPCLLLGWWAKRRWGLRWIVFCWDPPALSWRDRHDLAGRMVVRCVDFCFRISVRHADRIVLNIHPGLLGEVGFRARSQQVIRMFNGCMPQPAREQSLSGAGDPWSVGVLSSATEAKGFGLVLETFVGLSQALPRLKIVWVGKVSPETRERLLRRLAHERIPAERFVLAGWLTQCQAFQAVSSCGVLLHPYLDVPSLKWNYPLKLIEYMSLGRAILAADLPGVAAYVVSGENGHLFRAGDRRSLEEAMRALLGNEVRQTQLAERAKQDAKKFEWPNLNRELAAKLCEE